MHRIWLSLDTGIDDAFALLLALKEDNIVIEGISATYGNVPLENTFLNTRALLAFANKEDIKVYKGSKKPLIDDVDYGFDCHGENGINNLVLPQSKAYIEEESAFDAFYKCAKRLKGELELVMIGPSTDFANTYFKYPDITKYIKRVLIMGGSIYSGNKTSQAEFNIHADPIASKILFNSSLPIVMFPLEVTMSSYFDMDDVERVRSIDNKVSDLFIRMTKNVINFYKKHTGRKCVYFHDGCPIAYLNDETIFEGVSCSVEIETKSKLAYGKTVCDYDCDVPFNTNKVEVILKSDRDRFVSHCLRAFRRY